MATGSALLVAVTMALPPIAQDPAPSLRRVAWPLADFVVVADSTHGVQLVASPNLNSRQGRTHFQQATLSLDPRVARHWAQGVAAMVDSVARMPRRERAPFETVPLAANLGRTRMLVSMDGKGPSSRPFVFVVSDANRDNSWWVEVSDAELRRLLSVIDTIAQHSALDAVSPGAAFLACDLDEPPRRLEDLHADHPGKGTLLGREGRVLVRFIIDSSGAVPPDRIQVLMSDGDDLSRSARKALSEATYQPGRRGGRAVNTVAWQWFAFQMLR